MFLKEGVHGEGDNHTIHPENLPSYKITLKNTQTAYFVLASIGQLV